MEREWIDGWICFGQRRQAVEAYCALLAWVYSRYTIFDLLTSINTTTVVTKQMVVVTTWKKLTILKHLSIFITYLGIENTNLFCHYDTKLFQYPLTYSFRYAWKLNFEICWKCCLCPSIAFCPLAMCSIARSDWQSDRKTPKCCIS